MNAKFCKEYVVAGSYKKAEELYTISPKGV